MPIITNTVLEQDDETLDSFIQAWDFWKEIDICKFQQFIYGFY